LLSIRSGELHVDVSAEQPREHVPVHERAELAEHRLHLGDPALRQRVQSIVEPLFVGIRRLGHFHEHDSAPFSGPCTSE